MAISNCAESAVEVFHKPQETVFCVRPRRSAGCSLLSRISGVGRASKSEQVPNTDCKVEKEH
jgi:hypothetical protein